MAVTVRGPGCGRSTLAFTHREHLLNPRCRRAVDTDPRRWRVRFGAVPVTVEVAGEVSDELVDALALLVPQLSSSSPPPTRAQVAEVVASPATRLLVARDDSGRIVGSLTLVLFRIPTGLRAWIEDVMVDQAVRRSGAATALNRRALDLAAEAGAKTVDLTSRPSREAANRLYQKIGFVPRETNVYRFDLGG
jgi:ribosomal protein S18 acetylase RimI-like enzyme